MVLINVIVIYVHGSYRCYQWTLLINGGVDSALPLDFNEVCVFAW